jgi:hypothetical protein
MKWQILEVLETFISFLYAFDRKRGHNMLAFMFDMWFKNMWLMISYLGHDYTIVVVEYNEKLFILLLIKASKLLMHVSVEEIEDIQFQNNAENLFHPIIITSGTRDLRTPVATPLQPPRTCSGPDRRCAGIRTSHVYPHVISPGIYSITHHEKTQNPGSNIFNLGSRKFWKFPKTRSSI